MNKYEFGLGVNFLNDWATMGLCYDYSPAYFYCLYCIILGDLRFHLNCSCYWYSTKVYFTSQLLCLFMSISLIGTRKRLLPNLQ
jgi:hypothetical protein